jgi:hypothetical protein
MTPREGSAGAGFQVTFEANGGGFVGEVERHHDCPRPVACRMATPACVVRGETRVHVMCEADVRSIRFR